MKEKKNNILERCIGVTSVEIPGFISRRNIREKKDIDTKNRLLNFVPAFEKGLVFVQQGIKDRFDVGGLAYYRLDSVENQLPKVPIYTRQISVLSKHVFLAHMSAKWSTPIRGGA